MKTLLSICALVLPLQLLADTADPAHPRPQLEVGRYLMHVKFKGGGEFRDELHIDEVLLMPDLNISGRYSDHCAYQYAEPNGVSYSVSGSIVSPGLFSVPIRTSGTCILIAPTQEIVNLYFNLDEGGGEKTYLLDLRFPRTEDAITQTDGTLYQDNGFTFVDVGSFRLERTHEPGH